MEDRRTASLSEFAKSLGVRPSYVTKLKAAGRLVLTDDGRVDVEASNARIAATADPNRDDVRARHAAARAEKPAADDSDNKPLPPSKSEPTTAGQSFAASRAVKERYLALNAKLEYERAAGRLVEVAAVQHAGAEAGAALRLMLDNLPDRLSPLLAEGDAAREQRIYAHLREHVEQVLGEFSRRLESLARDVTQART